MSAVRKFFVARGGRPGQILSGELRVQYFSWKTGSPVGKETVQLDELENCKFYKTECEWRTAVEEAALTIRRRRTEVLRGKKRRKLLAASSPKRQELTHTSPVVNRLLPGVIPKKVSHHWRPR